MDLGVIGNCAVAALVSREGAINWFCLPRFDGDPVFHSLMGHGAGEEGDGEFAVELEDGHVSSDLAEPAQRDDAQGSGRECGRVDDARGHACLLGMTRSASPSVLLCCGAIRLRNA